MLTVLHLVLRTEVAHEEGLLGPATDSNNNEAAQQEAPVACAAEDTWQPILLRDAM